MCSVSVATSTVECVTTGTGNTSFSPLCHPGCAASGVEPLARDVVSALLQDNDLERVCEVEPKGRKKPDFRSERHAVEVKELVSQSMVSYRTAHDRHFGDGRHFPVESLRNIWGVMPDLTAAMESSEGDETPYLPRLIKRLTPFIKELEAKGLTDALADRRIARGVASLIHRGSCSVIPNGPYPPGIFIVGYGWGHSRTTDPERDVVGFIQDWLATPLAENTRQKFEHETAGLRHVVALVANMEGPASAMIRTLAEEPEAPLRTPLQLPEEVDAVIVIAGNEVLDYGVGNGWRRTPLDRLDLN